MCKPNPWTVVAALDAALKSAGDQRGFDCSEESVKRLRGRTVIMTGDNPLTDGLAALNFKRLLAHKFPDHGVGVAFAHFDPALKGLNRETMREENLNALSGMTITIPHHAELASVLGLSNVRDVATPNSLYRGVSLSGPASLVR